MRHVLDTDQGHEHYRQRRETVEPLFGHNKHNRTSPGFTAADVYESGPNGGC